MYRRTTRAVVLIAVVCVTIAAAAACQPAWSIIDPAKVTLPATVKSWVDSYKYIEVATSITDGDYTYYLASYGLKDSGQYKVVITGVETGGTDVVVKSKWTAPASFAPVDPHYPYSLARTKKTTKAVKFTAEGGTPDWIPSLVGVPAAFRIQPPSETVLYSTPKTDSVELGMVMIGTSGLAPADGQWVVEGIARAFEGTVEYDLVGADNEPFDHGFVTAAAGGPEWGYFVLNIPIPETEVEHIRVYTTSAEDGSIRDLVLIVK